MLKNLKKKKKGFTLIELIIVIAIIAILAAVAIPKFGDVRRNANIKSDIANAKTIQNAVSSLIADGQITNLGQSFTFDGTADANTDEDKLAAYIDGNAPKSKYYSSQYFKVVITDGNVAIKVNDGASQNSQDITVYPNGEAPYDK